MSLLAVPRECWDTIENSNQLLPTAYDSLPILEPVTVSRETNNCETSYCCICGCFNLKSYFSCIEWFALHWYYLLTKNGHCCIPDIIAILVLYFTCKSDVVLREQCLSNLQSLTPCYVSGFELRMYDRYSIDIEPYGVWGAFFVCFAFQCHFSPFFDHLWVETAYKRWVIWKN